MSFNGFVQAEINGQKRLDLLMPLELKDLFTASIYCRGDFMDSSEGDPLKIWELLSYKYNNIKLVAPYQTHGTNIIASASEHALPFRPEADAILIDSASDSAGSLRFADCAPVVISSAFPDPWMLLVHSGFVGTVKGISELSLETVSRLKRGVDLRKTYAWIGPCICGKCYSRKIGDPATQSAAGLFSPENYFLRNEMIYFDIKEEIKNRLLLFGIQGENISSWDDCTLCGDGSYYSYRGGDQKSRIFLIGNYHKKAV